jgi:PiT family inorganic phosphate transporter
MSEAFILLILVVLVALFFDFINGFHDAANAIATSVSTRVLSPRRAILMAAVLNLVGALSGTAVAKTIGSGLVTVQSVTQVTILSALFAAILWDLITWYFGLPTSSSHALMAGLVGAAISTAGPGALIWAGLEKILIALVLSPLLGFLMAVVLMSLLLRIFSAAAPVTVTVVTRRLQILSAAYMAFSHGNNDAQKSMGVITTALVSYYSLQTFEVPLWVILTCAVAMGLGTAVGGWRIIKTLGLRLTALRPIHGFAAEVTAATVIEAASRMGIPISTTHTISASVMGVGATKRLSAVKWGVGLDIVVAWILTLPACAVMAWAIYKFFALLF